MTSLATVAARVTVDGFLRFGLTTADDDSGCWDDRRLRKVIRVLPFFGGSEAGGGCGDRDNN
jgi:hypothetical protein